MALQAGVSLGPYEILGPLGAGGMGEVYRAHDSRLNREVALKVLPDQFAKDAERLRRFEQEAHAVAALNHPNILSVHDIGSQNGAPYVVYELLEGQTLREKLKESALPQRKALDYAVQMAQGLAAAHEKGIVHRDLKPDNIFVARDGRVKILDFGLAKLTLRAAAAEDMTAATSDHTSAGVVLGTASYMSPEQVRGEAVDARSDIFSFGTVLYEMLTGQRAFRADTALETMTAILKQEPPPLVESNAQLSPGLDRVVGHCLEKEPNLRFQSARDLAFALQDVSSVTSSTGMRAVVAARSRRRLYFSLAGTFGLLVAVAVAYMAGKRSSAAQPDYQQLTFRRGFVDSARFAPDGESIVYSASWEGSPFVLFTTRRDNPQSTPLALSNAKLLAVSSTGELAVSVRHRYFTANRNMGTLARVPLSGGAPRELLENVSDADWSPDGQELAVVHYLDNGGGKAQIEYPIGKPIYETLGWVDHIRVSPDGSKVAFLDHALRFDDRGDVAVVDRSGKKQTLSPGWSSVAGLAWSRDGNEIWFSSAQQAQPGVYGVDLKGHTRTILRTAGPMIIHDVARDGRLLLVRETRRTGISGLFPGQERERDLSWMDWSRVNDISADGQWVLFDEEGAGSSANYDVYLRKTDGSPGIRLGEGYAAGLSPDGKWALSRVPSVPPRVMLLPTGAGETKDLTPPNLFVNGTRWLPDSRHFLMMGRESDDRPRVYLQDIAGGAPKAVTDAGVPGNLVSPDGKWLTVGKGGKPYLMPLDGGELRPLTPPSDAPPNAGPVAWTNAGLVVATSGELPARLYNFNLATDKLQLWKQLLPLDSAGVYEVGAYAITPDQKYYAYSYVQKLTELYLVSGVH